MNPEHTNSQNAVSAMNNGTSLVKAIVYGGVVSGVLDALDGVVVFYALLGLNPVQVLQYIASGALGKSAFEGGLVTAGLGTFFHFLIAFVAAAVYVLAATQIEALRKYWVVGGLVYGAWVWVFMNFGVLPLSRVDAPAITLPLVLNGVIGHAALVGLPIAYYSRKVGA